MKQPKYWMLQLAKLENIERILVECDARSYFDAIKAIASVDAESCEMEKKVRNFTHFEQKNTHISGCKIVHLCTIATVIVHIIVHKCTITVALAFIILLVFSLSFSLFLWLLSLSPHFHCRQSSENATPCINREHHIKKFLPKSSKTRN